MNEGVVPLLLRESLEDGRHLTHTVSGGSGDQDGHEKYTGARSFSVHSAIHCQLPDNFLAVGHPSLIHSFKRPRHSRSIGCCTTSRCGRGCSTTSSYASSCCGRGCSITNRCRRDCTTNCCGRSCSITSQPIALEPRSVIHVVPPRCYDLNRLAM